VCVAVAISPLTAASAAVSTRTTLAPVLAANAPDAIPGSYIVVLKNSASSATVDRLASSASKTGANVSYTYHTAIKGFAATLSASQLSALRADPAVAYVETDSLIQLDDETVQPADTQKDPTLGSGPRRPA